MKSELIVDVNHEEVSIALLEDSRLVSLQKESRNIAYAVGDLYMAKVKKIMPGLNAAFLDVGYDKDAFLHYLDLGPQFSTYSKFLEEAMADKKKVPAISRFKPEPDIPKQGTIQDVVKPGQVLLVQIAKEPISSKGPRLTTEISFTGRYMVLMPFGNKISVSQKIKSTEEKNTPPPACRLDQAQRVQCDCAHTSAENKKVAELNNEIRTLVKCWEDSIAKMQRSQTPSLIYEEDSRTVSVIRDMFSPNFENIYVNESETFTQIQNYVALIAPENKDIVKLYAKRHPDFRQFQHHPPDQEQFRQDCVVPQRGLYHHREHRGSSCDRCQLRQSQQGEPGSESNALDVNLRAADEIARQLRLRDMGGIIVVDFIDMNKAEHRQTLYDHMREVMANDRARHNILPLSKFGLMQITRQRVRPAFDITTSEQCPLMLRQG